MFKSSKRKKSTLKTIHSGSFIVHLCKALKSAIGLIPLEWIFFALSKAYLRRRVQWSVHCIQSAKKGYTVFPRTITFSLWNPLLLWYSKLIHCMQIFLVDPIQNVTHYKNWISIDFQFGFNDKVYCTTPRARYYSTEYFLWL